MSEMPDTEDEIFISTGSGDYGEWSLRKYGRFAHRFIRAPEWVKCSDRLPTVDDGDVWATYQGIVEVVPWHYVVKYASRVTHWQPCVVPPPPEEK